MSYLSLLLFMGLFCFTWKNFASQHHPPTIKGRDVISNKEIQFENNKDLKALAVVFLSARCPCSMNHENSLKNLHEDFSKKGIRFIGVHSNHDESPTESHDHFAASKLPFPIIDDTDAKLADEFGALKTPHVFLLNPAGEVLYQGGVDDSHNVEKAKKFFLREALNDVLEGRPPKIAESRSLGCHIKRP